MSNYSIAIYNGENAEGSFSFYINIKEEIDYDKRVAYLTFYEINYYAYKDPAPDSSVCYTGDIYITYDDNYFYNYVIPSTRIDLFDKTKTYAIPYKEDGTANVKIQINPSITLFWREYVEEEDAYRERKKELSDFKEEIFQLTSIDPIQKIYIHKDGTIYAKSFKLLSELSDNTSSALKVTFNRYGDIYANGYFKITDQKNIKIDKDNNIYAKNFVIGVPSIYQ